MDSLGLIVTGFPVTVVLSWTYDLILPGVVRTPDEVGLEPADPPSETRAWLALNVIAVVVGLVRSALRV